MNNETNKAGGEGAILVPLGRDSKKGYAVVDKDDWEFLQKLGVSTTWNLSARGVVIAAAHLSKSGTVRIARVLMDAGPGQIVKHKDGNKLDLRRENLELRDEGYSLVRDREFLTPLKKRKKSQRKEFIAV